MAVFGLGYGLVFPAATAMVTESAGSARRGMAFGVFYAVYSLGVAIGSAGSGRLAGFYEDFMGLPFFVAAVVVLVAAPIVGVISVCQMDVNRPALRAPRESQPLSRFCQRKR